MTEKFLWGYTGDVKKKFLWTPLLVLLFLYFSVVVLPSVVVKKALPFKLPFYKLPAAPKSTTSVKNPGIYPTQPVVSNNFFTIRNDSPDGAYFADLNKMTLYYSDNDSKDTSNCDNQCIKIWIPYGPKSTPINMPSALLVIKRKDGSSQFSYKGKPLYLYIQDRYPGDRLGDGVDGVWHTVKP